MTDKDTPEICAARAADPVWRAEQARKSEAAAERFVRYRESIGLPLIQRKTGQRV